MITDNKRELTQTVNGQTTSFEYDTMGRQTKVTAPGNVVTNTTYYPTGEVKRIDGATYPVEYTYNGLGNQATMTTFKDADTPQQTSWSYNNRGQMTAKTYADNSSVTYTYNGDGQLLTRTWARDVVATYTYDAAGRITGLSYSDNTPSIAVTYNFLDQPVTITDAAGTRTLTYNAQSRLENETIPGIMDNMVNSYSYDAYGRLILRQLTTTGTTQAVSGIAYDVKGRVASVGNGADTLHYAYRPGLNRLATATWRNSQNAELNSRTYAYDTYHRLTGINLNNVSEVTYTLNAKDQRTAASYAVGGAWSYSYDEKSQVTGATGNNTTYSYTYDGIGNRLTAAEGSNTWSYTSNLLNQYTAINSNQPTYDADGNMLTTGDGWLYTWNGENRLIRAENSDTLVEMAYDYMGRRIEKKVSSKGVLSFYSWSLEKHYKFAYDGYKLIAIYDAANNNALLMTFTWQPQSVGLDVPVSMTCDGNTYYYVTDGNKNVTGLLDQAGTRVAEYVYGPFGQLLSAEGELADVNPFRFSSEYADDETGLVYYNYRYYSPQLGRWTKRDPIEEQGGVNLYKICNNNNINNFDALGFFVIYIETVGWGHVGINLSGESYDFGRYAGRYKWSLYSGPNVLRKRLGLPNNTEKVTYHKYNFKVCKELEDAIAKYVRNIYSSLPRSFPQAVIDKLDAPRQLHANERYHGTDWAPNGWNCITFTFSSLTGGVRQIVNMRKTVSAEAKRQAKLIIQLNFRVSFSIGMDAVKATLESFKAANKRWVE